MLSCGIATAARCEVRWPCRTISTAKKRYSSSFPSAATPPSSSASSRRKEQPSVAPRPSPGRRGRRVVAAASESQKLQSCRRDLLVVGPGVLGSLVCQRWLNVREHTAQRTTIMNSFFLFRFFFCRIFCRCLRCLLFFPPKKSTQHRKGAHFALLLTSFLRELPLPTELSCCDCDRAN